MQKHHNFYQISNLFSVFCREIYESIYDKYSDWLELKHPLIRGSEKRSEKDAHNQNNNNNYCMHTVVLFTRRYWIHFHTEKEKKDSYFTRTQRIPKHSKNCPMHALSILHTAATDCESAWNSTSFLATILGDSPKTKTNCANK